MLSRCRDDEGQLAVLVIAYAAIAAVLIVVGIDVSKVFLAKRALSSAADAAVLAAAQAADRALIYSGTAECGGLLPLDPQQAQVLVDQTLADDATDLQHTFASMDEATTVVDAGTVSVHMSGAVNVPFGRVLAWLDPADSDGRVHVAVTSHAESGLTAPGGC